MKNQEDLFKSLWEHDRLQNKCCETGAEWLRSALSVFLVFLTCKSLRISFFIPNIAPQTNMIRMMEEHELVVRMIDGDESAFSALYVAYRDRLRFYSLRFLKSQEYADDILQDVFSSIWVGRHLINPDMPFSSYIYTVLRNCVFNHIQKLEKQDLLREHLLIHAMDSVDNTQDEVLSNDLKSVIEKAYNTLSPRQKEVFLLSREGCLSYKEIAEQLNISVNTVHDYLSSSLHIIRQFLLKYSGIEIGLFLLLYFCC